MNPHVVMLICLNAEHLNDLHGKCDNIVDIAVYETGQKAVIMIDHIDYAGLSFNMPKLYSTSLDTLSYICKTSSSQ